MGYRVIRKFLPLSIFTGLVLATSAMAGPEEDRLTLVNYYTERFPDVPLQEFANGLYAFDEDAREQWIEMEDFPPYEIAIEDGQALFEAPFANGKSYADCFDNGGIGVRQDYPYFDTDAGEVMTLELMINRCRESNGEELLPYQIGDLAAISAYMAYTRASSSGRIGLALLWVMPHTGLFIAPSGARLAHCKNVLQNVMSRCFRSRWKRRASNTVTWNIFLRT